MLERIPGGGVGGGVVLASRAGATGRKRSCLIGGTRKRIGFSSQSQLALVLEELEPLSPPLTQLRLRPVAAVQSPRKGRPTRPPPSSDARPTGESSVHVRFYIKTNIDRARSLRMLIDSVTRWEAGWYDVAAITERVSRGHRQQKSNDEKKGAQGSAGR